MTPVGVTTTVHRLPRGYALDVTHDSARAAPRRRRWLRSLVVVVVVLVSGVSAYVAGTMLAPRPARIATVLQTPRDASDLALIDGSDRVVTLGSRAADARWTVVFFGFLACPDVCPLTMARLAEGYRDLGEPNDLQVVMITVDPVSDPPAAVDAYARAFHPDFRGFGGDSAAIAAAAARFFVGYAGEGSTIVHTDALLLVDRDGVFRAVYGSGVTPEVMRELGNLAAGAPL